MALNKKQMQSILDEADRVEQASDPELPFDKQKYIDSLTTANLRIQDRLDVFGSDGLRALREIYPYNPSWVLLAVTGQVVKIKEACTPAFNAIDSVKDTELKILIKDCIKDLLDIYLAHSEQNKTAGSFGSHLQ